MAAGISTGIIGLSGAVIGGGFTLAGQYVADRRAQRREALATRRNYLGALRLTVMDLERSIRRLDRMQQEDPTADAIDPRGFAELPRGAWVTYRSLLAPRLGEEVLKEVTDAYNQIIEWNEVIWAAFAKAPPDSFHDSDEHALSEPDATRLLREKYLLLKVSITLASARLTEVRDHESGMIRDSRDSLRRDACVISERI